MKGLNLCRLSEILTKVPTRGIGSTKYRKHPLLYLLDQKLGGWQPLPGETSDNVWEQKLGKENFKIYLQSPIDFYKNGYKIRRLQDTQLTFEDQLRLSHSCVIECCWERQMSNDEPPEFQRRNEPEIFNPDMRVVGKIRNSMWRYGYKTCWNTLADAFNNIRNFKLNNFEITLDWTVGCNEKGYATYNRDLFLDGPLAYLVHLNGKHVMTISFAVLGGHKIAITQIQLVHKTGNRFLYQFDRKTKIIEAFRKTFPKFSVWMITGDSAADSIRKSINYMLAEKKRALERAKTTEEKLKVVENYQQADTKDACFASEIEPRLRAFYPTSDTPLKTGGYEFARMLKRA